MTKPAAEMTALEVLAYKSRMRGGAAWPANWTVEQAREQIAYEQSQGWKEVGR